MAGTVKAIKKAASAAYKKNHSASHQRHRHNDPPSPLPLSDDENSDGFRKCHNHEANVSADYGVIIIEQKNKKRSDHHRRLSRSNKSLSTNESFHKVFVPETPNGDNKNNDGGIIGRLSAALRGACVSDDIFEGNLCHAMCSSSANGPSSSGTVSTAADSYRTGSHRSFSASAAAARNSDDDDTQRQDVSILTDVSLLTDGSPRDLSLNTLDEELMCREVEKLPTTPTRPMNLPAFRKIRRPAGPFTNKPQPRDSARKEKARKNPPLNQHRTMERKEHPLPQSHLHQRPSHNHHSCGGGCCHHHHHHHPKKAACGNTAVKKQPPSLPPKPERPHRRTPSWTSKMGDAIATKTKKVLCKPNSSSAPAPSSSSLPKKKKHRRRPSWNEPKPEKKQLV